MSQSEIDTNNLYDDIEESCSEEEIDNPVNDDDDFADLFNQIIQFLKSKETSGMSRHTETAKL
jgi:hypothetical protein